MMCEWNTVSTSGWYAIYYKERGSGQPVIFSQRLATQSCLRRPDALNCSHGYRATAP